METSACRCNRHFAFWHQSEMSVLLAPIPFLLVRLGADFLHLRMGSSGAWWRGERSDLWGRKWENPALPSFKMAAQASARSRQRARVFSPQSPAREAGLRWEEDAHPAAGPEVIGLAAASASTTTATP